MNYKMLKNEINSVTAAVDQEKTVGGRFSRRRYGTVTKYVRNRVNVTEI